MLSYFIGKYIIKVRVFLLRRKLSNKDSKIFLEKPFYKINIIKQQGARFIVKGTLKFYSFMGETTPINIILGKNATLKIDGDFVIGPGIKIHVAENALLKIGGNSVNESGLTCNSRIMVSKKIEIGKHFICAWNTFITDSNWHHVDVDGKTSSVQSDVHIGDNVWICPDCSILKGTKIGSGSIVGTKSLLSEKKYPQNSIIAGVPAKVIKKNCRWKQVLI